MKREYKLIASITGAVIVCALVLMYLRRKESYTNSFSNGNSGPEIVELNAKIRAWYRPYGWTARRLLITSGLIRVVTVTTVHIHRTSGYQNKPLRHMVAEPVSDISPDAKLPHLRWCSRKDGPAMINTRSSTSHAMTDHQKPYLDQCERCESRVNCRDIGEDEPQVLP
jgi:hypothetical protein